MKHIDDGELVTVTGGWGVVARAGVGALRVGAAGVRGVGRWALGGPMFPSWAARRAGGDGGGGGGGGGCSGGNCGA